MSFSIIFIQAREDSVKTNYIVHVSYTLTLCMAGCIAVALIVVNKCDLCHFA